MRWCLLVGWVCSGCDGVFGLAHVATTSPGADATAIDAVPACWSFSPANYAPCEADFPPSMGTNRVTIATTIDTTTMATYGSGVVLLHYDELTVAAGIKLTIKGTNPVVIVADGPIQVLGTISVTPTTVATACTTTNGGVTAMNWSPGGGGGSYGDVGAGGGGPNGPPKLDPLRGGCPGGRSGDAMGALQHLIASGVGGGLGGGALELSSNTSVEIVGGVFADGNGGQGGVATTATADSNCFMYGGMQTGHDCDSGGGGGGTGGSLLVEGVDVTITGSVCAVGGGGGAGGKVGGVAGSGGLPGADCTPGLGGTPNGIPGGTGGGMGAATSGGSGGSFTSGGGGGGSVGRIRVRAVHSPVVTGAVVPSPVQT